MSARGPLGALLALVLAVVLVLGMSITAEAARSKAFTSAPVPKITGSSVVGSTVKVAVGKWTPAPTSLSYQWLRNGVAIKGATRTSYVLAAADGGAKVTVAVTAKRSGYTTTKKTSAALSIPLVTKNFTSAPTPTLSGTVAAGSTVTAKVGAWMPTPSAFTYRWLRGGATISGATGSTYAVTPADAGASLSVSVTASKPGYQTTTRTSAAVAVPVIEEEPDEPNEHCGALARNETWGPGTHVTTCTVTVPGGVVLTISPGATVLVGLDDDLLVKGLLRAHGAPGKPILFDTALDVVGNTMPSKMFELAGFDGGKLDLSSVEISHGWLLFSDGSVTDSTLNDNVSIGPGPAGSHPVLERNRITAGWPDLPGLMVRDVADVTGIALTGPDTNTFRGGSAQQKSVEFEYARVPAGREYHLGPDSGLSAFTELPLGAGTVILDPGTIVRGSTEAENLKARGTAADPVIFAGLTSYKHGGDVYGLLEVDWPFAEGQALIARDGARIDLQHVLITDVDQAFEYQYENWGGPRKIADLRITDSVVEGPLNLHVMDRPVVARTVLSGAGEGCFAGGSCRFMVRALDVHGVADVTGIVLEGADRNTFVGTPLERSVAYARSAVPAGATYRLSPEGGVSAFVSRYTDDGLQVDGTLEIAPGTVLKGQLSVSGTVHARGTAQNPVYFTSVAVAAFGGETNGSNCADCWQDDPLLKIRGAGSTLDHVVMAYARVGVSLEEFSHLLITNSKIVSTTDAIVVAPAGSADMGTNYLYSMLPCAPPWDSRVDMLSSWIGADGFAGTNFDLSSFGGVVGDLAGQPALGSAYSEAAGSLNLTAQIGTNKIPWALYECGLPGDTPITILFPMTPVSIAAPAMIEWRPDVADHADPHPEW